MQIAITISFEKSTLGIVSAGSLDDEDDDSNLERCCVQKFANSVAVRYTLLRGNSIPEYSPLSMVTKGMTVDAGQVVTKARRKRKVNFHEFMMNDTNINMYAECK